MSVHAHSSVRLRTFLIMKFFGRKAVFTPTYTPLMNFKAGGNKPYNLLSPFFILLILIINALRRDINFMILEVSKKCIINIETPLSECVQSMNFWSVSYDAIGHAASRTLRKYSRPTKKSLYMSLQSRLVGRNNLVFDLQLTMKIGLLRDSMATPSIALRASFHAMTVIFLFVRPQRYGQS